MTAQKRSPKEKALAPEPTAGAIGAVVFAWLPSGDYEQAVGLWPEFATSDRVAAPAGPLPHRQYCRAMQQQLIHPGVTAWPPGRNQPCWCGSGCKYKKCCATTTSIDTDPHQ